jgi:hypothetical protein
LQKMQRATIISLRFKRRSNMTNTQKLLQLATENPDLPIVPMVDYDVVGDGYGF